MYHTDDSGLPLFRWIGGKQRLLPILRLAVPPDISERKYHEPFLGAASLFFDVAPSEAVLSDANAELLRCYRFVRDNARSVGRALTKLRGNRGERHYYQVRELYNIGRTSYSHAAQFIYLNRTCFNGVFRVNERGKFNVPFGYKKHPIFPSQATLLRASELLRRATIKHQDFEYAMNDVRKGDFVYLDPPYPALDKTSYFAHYTTDRFSEDDQERLAECVDDADRRGALILVSNADTPAIRRLYSSMFMYSVQVTRFVSCRTNKRRASELLISNYPLPIQCRMTPTKLRQLS